ncbi:MAG: ATP-binding cassette domain-containing protein [Planctomycetota bacterium]
MSQFLVCAEQLGYSYGSRSALENVSFDVKQGGLFGLLGPNGSGKTTLFRLLSTLIPVQAGSCHIAGLCLAKEPSEIRRRIGVTFQSPAVDIRLTVEENLRCHGALYGLTGSRLRSRIDLLLEQFDLTGRRLTPVGQLSGGLKRRVELAKGLIHSPAVLLLDEPTTGLDPRARSEFWEVLRDHMKQHGTTTIVATHLMPEAELCHDILLLDRGVVIASGSPDDLQRRVSGERLTVRLKDADQFRPAIEQALQLTGTIVDDRLTFRVSHPPQQISLVLEKFREQILSLEFSRPSLEDVFMELTGRPFSTVEVAR